MWDNQSVSIFRDARKHGDDSNKTIGKPFIVQRMPLPVTKP